MLKAFGQFIFWLFGWKVSEYFPKDIKKAVVIAAPHTSNWDYVFALCAFFIMKRKIRFVGKKELFRFPLGILMRLTGGIPIDRSKSNNTVQAIVNLFQSHDELILLIPPEGTRGKVKEWKTGFYYVALGAGVPCALGYLDYKKKIAGIGPLFYPTGDYTKDLQEIQSFYRPIQAKYPELSSLNQF